MDSLFYLKGNIQHYDWGGYSFIPDLLEIENNNQKPYAEYWMGIHASNPSLIQSDAAEIPLNLAIEKNKLSILGKRVNEKYQNLPYLFKVLDVRGMLSIQVHPTKSEAEKGFLREEKNNIPINASYRNYKDANHKPEVMVALSDFWLLHGFKPLQILENELLQSRYFSFLYYVLKERGLKELYKFCMELPINQTNEILATVVERSINCKAKGLLTKAMPAWWIAEYYAHNPHPDNYDKGIFSLYFMNIVQLPKGAAIFQDAGVPHAYLSGQNVELMANSDNVLRGGFTNKHMDIPELINHIRFEPIAPDIIKPIQKDKLYVYPTDCKEFEISRIELVENEIFSGKTFSLEIFIVLEGSCSVCTDKTLHAKKGGVFGIIAEQTYTITAKTNTTIYRAAVPIQ